MAYKTGSFVWFELLTNDVAAAKAFYPEVLGWSTEEMDMGPGGTYTMFKTGDVNAAGTVEPSMEGVPNHWTSYLSVDDVDARAKKAESLGGKIIVPPTDIPGIGRFSVVADPEGATFNLFRGAESDDNATQAFHWNELWAKDAAKVVDFYEKLLDLTHDEMEMPQGKYYVLKSGPDQSVGGVLTSPDANIPSMWLPYVNVDDCDAAVERAKNHGASVKAEPNSVEGVGRFSIFADKSGAVIGVIKPDAAAH